MAKNKITLDTSGLEAMMARLARLEHQDAKKIVEEALVAVGEQISKETEWALAPAHLPAKGVYSRGATKESVIHDVTAKWEGGVAYIPVGFDFDKPGAGGFLIGGRKASAITGTPRMAPDYVLQNMFKKKNNTYMAKMQKEAADIILDQIIEKEGF